MPIPKVKEKRVGRAHRESDTLEIALVFFVVFLRQASWWGMSSMPIGPSASQNASPSRLRHARCLKTSWGFLSCLVRGLRKSKVPATKRTNPLNLSIQGVVMARPKRFELLTFWSVARRSIQLS